MHILYLHQYFVPPDGAGGTRSYEMARRLVKAGHRVTLVTSGADFPASYGLGGRRAVRFLDGIELRVIPVDYSNRLSHARRIAAFARFALACLLEVARVREVDLVFATSTPLTIAIPALLARLLHGAPMVFEVRDLWPELPVAVGALKNPLLIAAARGLERAAYMGARRVVALSPGMRDGVLRTGCRRPEEVSVIPNSCDVELFRVPESAGEAFLAAHPQLRGGPLVSYTGTLGPINGVGYLVELARAMLDLDPSIRFLVTGDGRERDAVRARAAETGVLGRNFWMLDPVPKSAVPALLSASALPVSLFRDIPEMRHNSANKFFDALAAGRPVMVNHEGWQADLLRRTGAGLVAPAGDPAAAAAALREFLGDPERQRRARAAAAALADGEFGRERLARELRSVLEEAAS